MKKNIIISLTALLIITVFSAVSYAKPVTIAVAPFKVTSESGLYYLKTGVIDLFASRLSTGNEVLVVDKAKAIDKIGQPEALTKENAAQKAKALGADYILFGHINETAKGITIESFVVGLKSDVIPFSEKSSQYDSADSILMLVNRRS